eukprot:GHVT01053395.1.p1 GENE.GHVT01053395.1~~GHVT01053395.1.p1  ORF type:complete len:415 (+),score=11.96 GHVT01053395.1:360-1604(+)
MGRALCSGCRRPVRVCYCNWLPDSGLDFLEDQVGVGSNETNNGCCSGDFIESSGLLDGKAGEPIPSVRLPQAPVGSPSCSKFPSDRREPSVSSQDDIALRVPAELPFRPHVGVVSPVITRLVIFQHPLEAKRTTRSVPIILRALKHSHIVVTRRPVIPDFITGWCRHQPYPPGGPAEKSCDTPNFLKDDHIAVTGCTTAAPSTPRASTAGNGIEVTGQDPDHEIGNAWDVITAEDAELKTYADAHAFPKKVMDWTASCFCCQHPRCRRVWRRRDVGGTHDSEVNSTQNSGSCCACLPLDLDSSLLLFRVPGRSQPIGVGTLPLRPGLTLFCLDGTWREVMQMYKAAPWLAQIQIVHLPVPVPSEPTQDPCEDIRGAFEVSKILWTVLTFIVFSRTRQLRINFNILDTTICLLRY